MKIPIIDNIFMTSDAHNIILSKELVYESGDKKGQKYMSAYAFFPTVVQALESVLDEKLGESTARTIKGLVSSHNELVKHFKELLGTGLEDKVKEKQNE